MTQAAPSPHEVPRPAAAPRPAAVPRPAAAPPPGQQPQRSQQAILAQLARRATSLRCAPAVPEVPLYLADDIVDLWRGRRDATGDLDCPPPYWAFAWLGGQGLARFLLDWPVLIAGQRVLDFGSGSGLCALAAVRAGASDVTAADTDSMAEAAIRRNARLNYARVRFVGQDLLLGEPPDVDVVLAGDVCYDKDMTAAVLPWLRRASDRGACVLLGDPGRTYLPRDVVPLASYDMPTTRDLEGVTSRNVGVYAL